jgi:hypothetical protein
MKRRLALNVLVLAGILSHAAPSLAQARGGWKSNEEARHVILGALHSAAQVNFDGAFAALRAHSLVSRLDIDRVAREIERVVEARVPVTGSITGDDPQIISESNGATRLLIVARLPFERGSYVWRIAARSSSRGWFVAGLEVEGVARIGNLE